MIVVNMMTQKEVELSVTLHTEGIQVLKKKKVCIESDDVGFTLTCCTDFQKWSPLNCEEVSTTHGRGPCMHILA